MIWKLKQKNKMLGKTNRDKISILRILQMSQILIVATHAPDLYRYLHKAAWSEHWDHRYTSTLQISLLIFGSRSLLQILKKKIIAQTLSRRSDGIWTRSPWREEESFFFSSSLSFLFLELISIRSKHGRCKEEKEEEEVGRWKGDWPKEVAPHLFTSRLMPTLLLLHSFFFLHMHNLFY